MDDDNTASNESDTETCMVVEIQENELGEIMLVERPRATERFCVVDCKIEPSEEDEDDRLGSGDVGRDNIEIVYLPDYGNPANGPVLLKQELLCGGDSNEDSEDEGFTASRNVASPKVYRRGLKRMSPHGRNASRLGETRLRSNPNVILEHRGIYRGPRDRSWTLKLDAKDFVQTKSISSVTTIHTNPRSSTRTDGLENETLPESRLVGKDIEILSPGPNILPHKCKYCDRAFRQSVSLQIHSTLHSQSIPDGCHVS